MNEFGMLSLIIGAVVLVFALWVKPTSNHHS